MASGSWPPPAFLSWDRPLAGWPRSCGTSSGPSLNSPTHWREYLNNPHTRKVVGCSVKWRPLYVLLFLMICRQSSTYNVNNTNYSNIMFWIRLQVRLETYTFSVNFVRFYIYFAAVHTKSWQIDTFETVSMVLTASVFMCCRWGKMGSPHKLAWFWMLVLEDWTKEKVQLF